MKEIIRYGFTLAFISMLAAGLLAGVNAVTRPKILAQTEKELDLSLKEVMPQAVSFAAVKSAEGILYYRALDKNKEVVGVVFKTSSKGYSSTIETVAGMLLDGTVTAIKVVNQSETPGLGTQVTESDFLNQFRNQKDLSAVQAISGATISSRAVIEAVKKKSAQIKELLEE